MNRATTFASTLAALLLAGSLPAAAQLVIGGESPSGVVVNWSVLERLGPPPNLADMLQNDGRPAAAPVPAAARPAGTGNVVFHPYSPTRPYKPVAAKPKAPKPAAEPVKTVSVPAEVPPPVTPAKPVKNVGAPAAPALPEPAPLPAKPVEAAKAPEPAKVVEAPKPVEPPKAPEPAKGPQISLPDVPKIEAKPVVAVPPPAPEKPVQVARIEPPPPPAPPPVAVPAAISAPVPPPVAPPVAAPVKPASLPAVPPAAIIKKGDSLSVVFPPDNSRLPDAAWNDLGAIAARMNKDESLSLQLLAYAEGDEASTSKARRLSLSRALAVRTFLMDQGVRSTRIEVRALGNKIEGSGPADRVDLVLGAK